MRLAVAMCGDMATRPPSWPKQTLCGTWLVCSLRMLAHGGMWLFRCGGGQRKFREWLGGVANRFTDSLFCASLFYPLPIAHVPFCSLPQSPGAPFILIPRATVREDPSAVEHTRITDRSVLYHTKASIYSSYYRSTFVSRPYVPLAQRPSTSVWAAPLDTPIVDLLTVATDPRGETFSYAHSEQWLAASLADLFGDTLIARRIRAPYVTPTHSRRLTRSVRDFSPAVWEAERAEVALVGSLAKFAANPALAAALVGTASGPAGPRTLVGASPRDREWGVGLSMDDPGVEDPEAWRGNNVLGEVLVRVRDVLMAQPGG